MSGARSEESDHVSLRCERCGRAQGVPLSYTEGRCIVACDHCGASIYWHQCEQCGLRYVGAAVADCPVCVDAELDELQID